MKTKNLETKGPLGRRHPMLRILFIVLIPLLLKAEFVSYGEDPFQLGVSIDALALGNIRALPMANPSPGANVASFLDRDLQFSFQHTEGFGGVYQTDVITVEQDRWSFLLFRGGVSGIADTREALLDYGSDGIPETMDSDGTEGNGIMDPGERLRINSVSYFSTQQLLLELGYSHQINHKLAVHGTTRLLSHDLYVEQGLGIGFHGGLLYMPSETIRLGVQITDMLTTTIFWSSGLTESYAPELIMAADYMLRFESVPFVLHPIFQVQIALDGEQADFNGKTLAYSGGLEIVFQNQLFIQLGRTELSQFQVGAMIHTTYLDLKYGTGFSDLSSSAGQTHRLGVSFKLKDIDLF
jgi:hypothetical protein